LRSDGAGEVRLVCFDGTEHAMGETDELQVPASALPLPEIGEDSAVGARATLTTARSLAGVRVQAAKAGKLLIGFDGLRVHAASLGWPLVILRDASGEASGTWRVSLSSPATLLLDAKTEAVLLVVGLGVVADAAGIGKALLHAGSGGAE